MSAWQSSLEVNYASQLCAEVIALKRQVRRSIAGRSPQARARIVALRDALVSAGFDAPIR